MVYPEIVEILVPYGADVNVLSDIGDTPLINSATKADGYDVMDTLLKLGADPNINNKYGKTALSISSSRGEEDKVELLKANGAV